MQLPSQLRRIPSQPGLEVCAISLWTTVLSRWMLNREIEVERIADDQFSEQRLLVMLIRVSVLVLCFKSRDAGWASLFCSFKEQGRVCPVFCWCGRRASTQMTKKRPAIVIAQDFSIWIGNTSEQSVTFEPGELLGFGTGAFEEKVISALAPIDRAE